MLLDTQEFYENKSKQYFCTGTYEPILFLPDSDPLFEELGRRAAFALFKKVSDQLKLQQHVTTTLVLVDLPEYAFITDNNLSVYNRFLLKLSKRRLLPITLDRDFKGDSEQNWYWTMKYARL